MSESARDEFSWLRSCTAEFGLDGCQIDVLTHPEEFYRSLKAGVENANRRVVLASLYLGTGELEKDLVKSMYEKCRSKSEGDQDFKMKVLLDFSRGSRGDINSRTMLLPLLDDYPSMAELALYHAPDLRGLLKRFMPDRYNETVGVSHLKVYLFDDTVIMSGANLSNDYFTNRQDRYVVIRDCRELADYLDRLVTAVSEFSFHVQSDDSILMPGTFPNHPYEDADDGTLFKSKAAERMSDFLKKYAPVSTKEIDSVSVSSEDTPTKGIDTWIYPLIQMGPLGITQDEEATKRLFVNASIGSKILLASGYFNLTEEYQDVILNSSKANFDVLMAAPEAMGFFGARGAAGAIPQAYTHLTRHFDHKISLANSHSRITLSEWMRDKWTFHVKGLWYYLPNSKLPSLTLIGSPNLGYRSVYKDLEAQVAIVTENKSLREKLHHEQLYINESSSQLNGRMLAGRHVQMWVKLVSRFFRSFF